MVRFALSANSAVMLTAVFGGLIAVLVVLILRRARAPMAARLAVILLAALSVNSIVNSGASRTLWTIDPASAAGRVASYDSAARELSAQQKTTFVCSNTFTPAATPTDLVTLTGSATKTIRLVSLKLLTNAGLAGSTTFFLIKRSTADTTGTFVSTPAVPLDSGANNNVSATATCGHYTANPGGLGTAVGTVTTERWVSAPAVPNSFAAATEDAGKDFLMWTPNSLIDQMVVLRGAAQTLAINFNGAALALGQTHAYRIVWTEE